MRTRLLAAMGFTALMGLALSGQAFAATAAAGYKVTDFATDFPNSGGTTGIGPIGLAFDATNHLYVMDYWTGVLYKFDSSGGSATGKALNASHPISGAPAGIAFSKTGQLYAALQSSGEVIEIKLPPSGNVLETRLVAENTGGATGIATDPLSGDLFVTNPFGTNIYRLHNFSSATVTATTYANVTNPDGITFGADGTIYVAAHGLAAVKITRSANDTPTVTSIAEVPSIDGIALAAGSSPANPSAIFGNRNDGKITKVDLTKTPPENSDIVTGGTRGDFSQVGPDGCLYATQTATVIKVTNADGTCSFATTVAVPILRLTPASQSVHVGSTATITATLTNASPASGHVVTFTVTGANPRVGTATTNSSGTATFTYAGTNTGQDTVSAATTANDQAVSSNSATVTWTAALPTPAPTPVALPATGGGPASGGTEPTAVLVLLGSVILVAAIGRLTMRRD